MSKKSMRIDFSKVAEFFLFPEHNYNIDKKTNKVLCNCYKEEWDYVYKCEKNFRKSCYGYNESFDVVRYESCDYDYPDYNTFTCKHNPGKNY